MLKSNGDVSDQACINLLQTLHTDYFIPAIDSATTSFLPLFLPVLLDAVESVLAARSRFFPDFRTSTGTGTGTKVGASSSSSSVSLPSSPSLPLHSSHAASLSESP